MDPHLIHMMTAMFMFLPFVGLFCIIALLIPYWMIWKKAGFSPWLSILMIVPLVNFVMLYVLAFADWKVAPVTPAVTVAPQL